MRLKPNSSRNVKHCVGLFLVEWFVDRIFVQIFERIFELKHVEPTPNPIIFKFVICEICCWYTAICSYLNSLFILSRFTSHHVLLLIQIQLHIWNHNPQYHHFRFTHIANSNPTLKYSKLIVNTMKAHSKMIQ